ncbi:hypothetical protein BVRB_4g088750 [Beta vulgaris subsp. vulgaris]|nr:hypothetical protein BVRB_4g088750 [Beta vulgaris subsp. vulgaris]
MIDSRVASTASNSLFVVSASLLPPWCINLFSKVHLLFCDSKFTPPMYDSTDVKTLTVIACASFNMLSMPLASLVLLNSFISFKHFLMVFLDVFRAFRLLLLAISVYIFWLEKTEGRQILQDIKGYCVYIFQHALNGLIVPRNPSTCYIYREALRIHPRPLEPILGHCLLIKR